MGGFVGVKMAGCQDGIPIECILSSAAAVGGACACLAVSRHCSDENKGLPQSRYNGALWGLTTGLSSGALMLYLKGREHVIPCHWPCVAGLVPPAAIGCYAMDASQESGKWDKVNFAAQFVTATMAGLTAVFWLSGKGNLK